MQLKKLFTILLFLPVILFATPKVNYGKYSDYIGINYLISSTSKTPTAQLEKVSESFEDNAVIFAQVRNSKIRFGIKYLQDPFNSYAKKLDIIISKDNKLIKTYNHTSSLIYNGSVIYTSEYSGIETGKYDVYIKIYDKNDAYISHKPNKQIDIENEQQSAINGECGNAHKTTFSYTVSSYPSGSLCVTGTASGNSFPSQGSTDYWTCSGSNGGTDDSCYASRNSAPLNQDPNKPTIGSKTFTVDLSDSIKISRGSDPDGDSVKLVCWATNSNRTTSNPFESSYATHTNDVTVSFEFSKIGSQTISCKSVDNNSNESSIKTKTVTVNEPVIQTPSVTSVFPLTAIQNTITNYTITGTNLTSSITGNIQGSSTHCSYVSGTSISVVLSCNAEVVGSKRFYLKDKSGGTTISGSENIYITVNTPQSILPPSVDTPVNGTGWSYRQHTQDNATYYDGIGSANDNNTWDLNYGSGYDDEGLPVYAVADGVRQTFDGWGGNSFGQFLIKHTNSNGSWYSGYLHMKNITTATTIKKGDKIGEISRTGYLVNPAITSPHLHFGVYELVNNQLLSRNITISKNKNWEIPKVNTKPQHTRTYTSLTNIPEATSFTINSLWQDNDGFNDNIKAYIRYKLQSTANWSEIELTYFDKINNDYAFYHTFSGLGRGTYDLQVSAEDVTSDNLPIHTKDWINIDGGFRILASGNDPTVTMVNNLTTCKSDEHKDKGYACIKTGSSQNLTFVVKDDDVDLKNLEVNVDGLGNNEFTKDLYGSSDTVSEEYNFSKEMFTDNCDKCTECTKYKNNCLREFFTLTATAYDNRDKKYESPSVQAKFLLYDLDVHNEQKKNIALAEKERKKKEAEEEKLRLEEEVNDKNYQLEDKDNELNNKTQEYEDKVEESLINKGTIPTGLINNDCFWREDGQCIEIWVDAESKKYGYKRKSENYKEYPYTIYVSYNFNRLYDMGAGLYPAELWVEYHAPKGIIDTFSHDVDHPRTSPRILVFNSKILEAEVESLVEMAKEDIDNNMELNTKLFLQIRRKMINSAVASAEEIERYILEMKEATLTTKVEMNLTEQEYLMALSLAVDSIPLISTSKSLSQLTLGQEWFTADVISRPEEALNVILSIYPPAKIARKAKKYGVQVDRAKLIIKNRKIGKQAEKLLKVNSSVI